VSPSFIEGNQAGGPAKGWTRTVMGVWRLTTVAIPVPMALYRLPTACVAIDALRGTWASAELAAKVLGGQSPSALPPAPPRKVRYAINRRTAAEMKLHLPERVLGAAAEVVN